MDYEQAVLQGDRRALARLITLVENDAPQGRQILDALFPHSGKAHIIGITGASGSGKSTLVNSMVADVIDRYPEAKVAVIAVDPSSPFSGGAVLGDRIRMRAIVESARVFVRSMASRGALGGLAHNTQAVSLILDAAGYDFIVIETVGAGQSEVEIARLAHTVLVVEAPGLGDDIQAAKAGILEIADILVLNKADRPGVDVTEMALKGMLSMGYPIAEAGEHSWVPPIQRTIATEAEGIGELVNAVSAHAAFLKGGAGWKRRDQVHLETFLRGLLQRKLQMEWQQIIDKGEYQSIFQQVYTRQMAPYEAITRIQP